MTTEPTVRQWLGLGSAIAVLAVLLAFAPAHRVRHRWHWALSSTYGIGDGLLGSGVACPHGGVLDTRRLLVANRTLPCGTWLWLCHRSGGVNRCTRAQVLDRGPYVRGRDLDLAPRVAAGLHFTGVGWVRWRLLRTR